MTPLIEEGKRGIGNGAPFFNFPQLTTIGDFGPTHRPTHTVCVGDLEEICLETLDITRPHDKSAMASQPRLNPSIQSLLAQRTWTQPIPKVLTDISPG
jgi:hypothetical protein